MDRSVVSMGPWSPSLVSWSTPVVRTTPVVRVHIKTQDHSTGMNRGYCLLYNLYKPTVHPSSEDGLWRARDVRRPRTRLPKSATHRSEVKASSSLLSNGDWRRRRREQWKIGRVLHWKGLKVGFVSTWAKDWIHPSFLLGVVVDDLSDCFQAPSFCEEVWESQIYTCTIKKYYTVTCFYHCHV